MSYEEMVTELDQRTGIGREHAGTVLAAVVQAVVEMAWDRSDPRVELPGELAAVEPAGPAEQRSLDSFIARVGDLTGAVDLDRAGEFTRSGFRVVAESLSRDELRKLMEALPAEYRELAPTASGLSGNEETLLADIRLNANLDTVEQARELAHAVLAVTGEASSAGQADDLADTLPEDLGAWLRSSTEARQTDSDRFLAEIVDRSRVTSSDLVRDHTAAVFTVLRRTAPKEFAETLDQLPKPIARLVG